MGMVAGAADVEEALRKSEERFRRYFDLDLVGVAITSPSKGMLEANDELCRILGYDRDELRAKTWAEMTHPDDLPADVAQFERVCPLSDIDAMVSEARPPKPLAASLKSAGVRVVVAAE